MDGIPETKKPHVPAICKLHEHSRGWIFRNKQTSAPVFVLHNVYIFTIISIYISLQLADIIRSTGIRCLAMLQTLATRLRNQERVMQVSHHPAFLRVFITVMVLVNSRFSGEGKESLICYFFQIILRVLKEIKNHKSHQTAIAHLH